MRLSLVLGMVTATVVLVAVSCAGDRDDAAGARDGRGVRPAPEAPDVTERPGASSTTGDPDATAPAAGAAACRPLGPAVVAGTLGDPAITESSGLAAGIRSPGVLYTHDDSGGGPLVFAMGTDGRPLATLTLAGAEAVDWEDMGTGPGPDPGATYLYIADTGGNTSPRSTVQVYRVPEPDVATSAGPVARTLDGVTRFDLTYPDGVARDAEALLVDPLTRSVHLVTKTAIGPSEVFRFDPTADGGTVPLQPAGTVTVPPPAIPLVTGGSVSPDGSLVVLRTYDRVLRFRRWPGATLAEALAGAPCADPLAPQPQGEAVAVGAGGDVLYVTSEGAGQAILAYTVGGP